jgi:hypothetical protein
MRLGFVLSVAMLALLMAASPVLADGAPHPAETAKAKKHKPKKKKCKKNKVRVKIAGRIRCLPLKAALPKPKAVDPRLAIVKEGLTPEIGHIPDPKNKIPPPAESLYRKFDPQALKGMEKAVGIAINRLDHLGEARARTSNSAHVSAESGNSFSTTIGGVKIDARLTIAIDATQQLVGTAEFTETRDQGGGRTVSVRTQMPIRLDHMGFEAKNGGCPSADGKVDATDSVGIAIQTEFRSNNGKQLDEYFIYEVADETDPLQGTVGDDAKLEELEIKGIEEITEKAGGSVFGGSIVNGSIVRNTVVNMRTGAYEPHVTVVSVGVVLSGILRIFTPLVRPQVAERLKRAADAGFAATVDFEMGKFRELEERWNTPNKCAKLAFGKANESLTLSLGESGDETVRVDAVRGGSPAKADWTVTRQENGELSLASHSDNPTKFHYKATKAGKAVKLKGTLKAVSKAGVAEESWVQKTESKAIEHIEGTFGGELSGATSLGVPSVQKWSGTAKFDRLTPPEGGGAGGTFLLTAGNVSIDLSGIEQSGITGCHQSGSAQAPISSGSMTVTGTGPEMTAPYDYEVHLFLPFMSIKATRHTCPKAAQDEGYEGTQFETGPVWKLDVKGQESADGLSFVGSLKEAFGSPPFVSTFEENWTLHGKP